MRRRDPLEESLLREVIFSEDPLARWALADYLEEQNQLDHAAYWRSLVPFEGLTFYQDSLCAFWRVQWLKHSCQDWVLPLEESQITELALRFYYSLGLAPPAVVFLSSPAEALRHYSPRALITRTHLYPRYKQLYRGFRDLVSLLRRRRIEQRLQLPLIRQVWQRLRTHILWDLRQDFPTQKRDWFFTIGYGVHEASWLGLLSYLLHVLRWEPARELLPFLLFSQQVGWYWPLDRLLLITPPPSSLLITNNKLVHYFY